VSDANSFENLVHARYIVVGNDAAAVPGLDAEAERGLDYALELVLAVCSRNYRTLPIKGSGHTRPSASSISTS